MATRLEILFSKCDTSGRGWIEVEEFKQICQDLGISKVISLSYSLLLLEFIKCGIRIVMLV